MVLVCGNWSVILCACPKQLCMVAVPCCLLYFILFMMLASWQVLVVFKTAPELCNLLKAVEEEFGRGRPGGLHQRSRLDGPHADVLPWIQSQAVVFETGAKASCRDVHTPPAVSRTGVLCLVLGHRTRSCCETVAKASCRHVHTVPAVTCSSMMCIVLNAASRTCFLR